MGVLVVVLVFVTCTPCGAGSTPVGQLPHLDNNSLGRAVATVLVHPTVPRAHFNVTTAAMLPAHCTLGTVLCHHHCGSNRGTLCLRPCSAQAHCASGTILVGQAVSQPPLCLSTLCLRHCSASTLCLRHHAAPTHCASGPALPEHTVQGGSRGSRGSNRLAWERGAARVAVLKGSRQ